MAAQALAGRFSHALIDERAHGSLADAAQLLDCPVLKFKHRDAADLARLGQRLGNIRPIVLTDGMFAHDGGVAPLKKYVAVLPGGAMLLVDDAHGAGVLGKNGRGAPEHEGVSRRQIIQTITLSKAFGVYGGAVLGSRELRARIIQASHLFIGSTPLPLPLASAAITSLAILKGGRRFRTRLFRNASYVRKKLRAGGFAVEESPGPIISVIPRGAKLANQLKRRLLAGGIYPPFVQYPGGPEGGHFRFVISSEHSQSQLDGLADALLSRK
jgi:7-keto-8-aminopelargonate synthetase-like enzyme